MQESASNVPEKDKIKNYNTERDILSGLIRFPEALYDIDNLISKEDFGSPVWREIFGVFRYLIVDKQIKKLDGPLILATIHNFRLTFPSVFNVSDGIQNLVRNSTDIEYQTIELLARDIKFYSIRREVWDCGSKLQKKMIESHSFGNIQEIISVADEIYFDAINNFVVEDDMIDLGAGAGAVLHQRAENPVPFVGFSTGFQYYDELIGHIRPDSFNFVSARNKVGKSMFGLNVATHVRRVEKIPVFYADSEMGGQLMRDRLIAHVAGVDINLVENGRWCQNPEMCKKIEAAIPIVEGLGIKYYSIRATNVAGMISACRRFLFKYVKRKPSNPEEWNRCLFVWDYIKLDYYNEKNMGNNWWLDMAKSVVHFKDFLGATQTSALVLGQQNQGGIAKMDKDKKMITADNEGVIAGTDEISKTASNISQLRFKTPEEIKRDGSDAGNCMLMPFACRTGGGGAFVQISEGQFEREYVCLQREPKQMTFKELTTNKILAEQRSISHVFKNVEEKK